MQLKQQPGVAPIAPAPPPAPTPVHDTDQLNTSTTDSPPNTRTTDSPLNGVANFTGNVNANSTSASPFGSVPTGIDPNNPAVKAFNSANLTYNLAGGGYIFGQTEKPGTQVLQQHYIGQPPKNDPAADKIAKDYYNYVGGLPQVAAGSPALTAFNAAHGVAPEQEPSINSKLGGPWSGPWEFPGWHLGP